MKYRNTPILVAALEKEGRICQLNPMSLNSTYSGEYLCRKSKKYSEEYSGGIY